MKKIMGVEIFAVNWKKYYLCRQNVNYVGQNMCLLVSSEVVVSEW